MALTHEQKYLLMGLLASIVIVAILSLGLSYFFKVDFVTAFLPGCIVSASTLWTRGGRNEWTRLSRLWQVSSILLAFILMFAAIALAERHRPGALIFAGSITIAAAALWLLYLLFSRAMDALWSRWQRRS